MGVILNLKNFFAKSKALKDNKKSINRAIAEEQLRLAKDRNLEVHVFGGARDRNLQAIYVPQRKKFKGYMRENKRK